MANTVQVRNPTGTTSALLNGDTIRIDAEDMLVTGVTTVSTVTPGVWTLTVTRAYNGIMETHNTVGDPVKKVSYPDRKIRVTNTGGTSSVQDGDTIQIDNERMLVGTVTPISAGVWSLAVTRAYAGSIETTHAAGTPVYQITADATTAVPVLYKISASEPKTLPDVGTIGGTFTYYGGLCIGMPLHLACTSANCDEASAYVGSAVSYTPRRSAPRRRKGSPPRSPPRPIPSRSRRTGQASRTGSTSRSTTRRCWSQRVEGLRPSPCRGRTGHDRRHTCRHRGGQVHHRHSGRHDDGRRLHHGRRRVLRLRRRNR